MTLLKDIAESRTSVRLFSKEPVNLDDVFYALDVARQAPSGANQQPWRFLIITESDVKAIIRRECERVEREFHENPPDSIKNFLLKKGITWRKKFLTDAPVLILVFGRKTAPYWVQSVWLSIGYMILALEEKGLASLTYTPSKTDWANEVLGVPKDYVLVAIIPVGKALQVVKAIKSRLPLNQVTYCGEWGRGCPEEQVMVK